MVVGQQIWIVVVAAAVEDFLEGQLLAGVAEIAEVPENPEVAGAVELVAVGGLLLPQLGLEEVGLGG